MIDFEVKVYRHTGDKETGEIYDGSYCSKVYSINENKFLVYDNGDNTACDIEPHFEWVCFTEFYEDICSNTYHYIVELKEQNK